MSHAGWSEQARAVICEALAEADALGLEGKARVALVDSRYPFGPRAMWPYKAWLAARKELVFGRKKAHARDRAVEPLPGQLDLFETKEDRP